MPRTPCFLDGNGAVARWMFPALFILGLALLRSRVDALIIPTDGGITVADLLATQGILPQGVVDLKQLSTGPVTTALPISPLAMHGRGNSLPESLMAIKLPTFARRMPPPPIPMGPSPPLPPSENPYTALDFAALISSFSLGVPVIGLAPGQHLTVAYLGLDATEVDSPMGSYIYYTGAALIDLFPILLFNVPTEATLTLQNVTFLLNRLELYHFLRYLATSTSAWPYTETVTIREGVIQIGQLTTTARVTSGPSNSSSPSRVSAGGLVHWSDVTLTCPGYGLQGTFAAAAAAVVTDGGRQLRQSGLAAMIGSMTSGALFLSVAADVALPTDGSWQPVLLPAKVLTVLLGKPERNTTIDLAGVERAWYTSSEHNSSSSIAEAVQMSDLTLINLPYTTSPTKMTSLLALSLQSFGIARFNSSSSVAQLVLKRCTIVIPDQEIAFLERVLLSKRTSAGASPSVEKLATLFAVLNAKGTPSDIPGASLFVSELRLGTQVSLLNCTLLSASYYSALPGARPLLPQSLLWLPEVLHGDAATAAQWGPLGLGFAEGLQDALSNLSMACGPLPSRSPVTFITRPDDQSVPQLLPPPAKASTIRITSGDMPAFAGRCIVEGYLHELEGNRIFSNLQGAIGHVELLQPITLRGLVLYNLAPGGMYPFVASAAPNATNYGTSGGSNNSQGAPLVAPQLNGPDAAWTNSSLPLWFFSFTRNPSSAQAQASQQQAQADMLFLENVILVVPELEWRALVAALLLQHGGLGAATEQHGRRLSAMTLEEQGSPLPGPPPYGRRPQIPAPSLRRLAADEQLGPPGYVSNGVLLQPAADGGVVLQSAPLPPPLPWPPQPSSPPPPRPPQLPQLPRPPQPPPPRRPFPPSSPPARPSTSPSPPIPSYPPPSPFYTDTTYAALLDFAAASQVASYNYSAGVLVLAVARHYGWIGTNVTVTYEMPVDAPSGAKLLSYPSPISLPYQVLADMDINVSMPTPPPANKAVDELLANPPPPPIPVPPLLQLTRGSSDPSSAAVGSREPPISPSPFQVVPTSSSGPVDNEGHRHRPYWLAPVVGSLVALLSLLLLLILARKGLALTATKQQHQRPAVSPGGTDDIPLVRVVCNSEESDVLGCKALRSDADCKGGVTGSSSRRTTTLDTSDSSSFLPTVSATTEHELVTRSVPAVAYGTPAAGRGLGRRPSATDELLLKQKRHCVVSLKPYHVASYCTLVATTATTTASTSVGEQSMRLQQQQQQGKELLGDCNDGSKTCELSVAGAQGNGQQGVKSLLQSMQAYYSCLQVPATLSGTQLDEEECAHRQRYPQPASAGSQDVHDDSSRTTSSHVSVSMTDLPPADVPLEVREEVRAVKADLWDPDLTFCGVIGRGTSGVVYRGLWRGLRVAIKTLVTSVATIAGPRGFTKQCAILESAISMSLYHPNIVATYKYDIKPLVQKPTPATTSPSTSSGSSMAPSAATSGTGSDAEGTADVFKLYIVQEFCNAGTLRRALEYGMAGSVRAGGLLRLLALRLALDVAQGMRHIHGCRVVHGDLKPDNVLLVSGPRVSSDVDDADNTAPSSAGGTAAAAVAAGAEDAPHTNNSSRGHSVGKSGMAAVMQQQQQLQQLQLTAKVADFGLSLPLPEGATHASQRFQGTPAYMAPEVATDGQVSPRADVWSFGLLLLELYYGCMLLDLSTVQMAAAATAAAGGGAGEAVLQSDGHASSSCSCPKQEQQPLHQVLIKDMLTSGHQSYAELVAACLAVDPHSRLGFGDIVRQLEQELLSAGSDM
ncbi:hypothetical protein Agub_g15894 [Astrephomene gubernaculifera]|uniref:Protein kinase domain-containing protein n=1 Tax=Astrephomene gubernaculifera TaxID=47775 RepID=A0AAD3E3S4_9CHLO|nr:hypothetical protein Agub_g15894 [Astrephomene gubernaculifera]